MTGHTHKSGDGRGPRAVFVNGNRVERATWADTRAGVVWFVPFPVRLNRAKTDVYRRKLRGTVTVEALHD